MRTAHLFLPPGTLTAREMATGRQVYLIPIKDSDSDTDSQTTSPMWGIAPPGTFDNDDEYATIPNDDTASSTSIFDCLRRLLGWDTVDLMP